MIACLAEAIHGWSIATMRNSHAFNVLVEYPDGFYLNNSNGTRTLWNPLGSWADAMGLVAVLRDKWTTATAACTPENQEFDSPFDDATLFERMHRHADRRWPWAFLYQTPRSISEAIVEMLGDTGEGGPTT